MAAPVICTRCLALCDFIRMNISFSGGFKMAPTPVGFGACPMNELVFVLRETRGC